MQTPSHLAKLPEHKTWRGMKDRCKYGKYKNKDIVVCERWMVFANFYEDMGKKPTPKHTIDRIDGKGNYEPTNCRWATYTEQNNNFSRNRRITVNGVSKTLAELSREYGLHRHTIRYRLNNGWPIEKIISVKPTHANRHIKETWIDYEPYPKGGAA